MSVDTSAEGTRVQDGIASVFDRASGYYRSMRWEKNRVVRYEAELTRRVIEDELGDTHVGSALEIGCGPGTWTPLLAARAAHVDAIDLSTSMLEHARATLTEPGVQFIHADAARFNADHPYDLVMSVRVLEYIPEWAQILRNLKGLVAPGGRAVIITKTPVSVWRGTGRERWFGPHTMARRLTGRSLDPDFWQEYLPVRDVRRIFDDAGFSDIRVRPVIFGLPVYVRGTKQYPIVPRQAEGPVLAATDRAWRWVTDGSQRRRLASLVFAESYAVSGRRKSA
jgi:ubiquinone/menaquinone biosynthesis C-methylase UbiE